MSLSRGEFLRSLGKSLPGMVFNSGAVTTAQKFLTKMAAADGSRLTPSAPVASPANSQPKTEPVMDRLEFINRGPTEGNRIALTFDDGPHAEVTPRLLDELRVRGLRATFFMIGKHIEAEPDLARRVLAEGHDIGNHTYSHPKLPSLPNDQAYEEIRRTQDVIGSVLNHRTRWFRPPFGALRPDQTGLVRRLEMRSILGDVSTGDWAFPGVDKIIAKFSEATAGSIIICHDFCSQTADCLPRALDHFDHLGLKLVTLSELFGKS